jgi:hypothetical protein
MESTIVPLVKCKSGDLTDVNNYRAIALSNAISKLLASVIACVINADSQLDYNQFGFKPGHSTIHCVRVYSKVLLTIRLYVSRGSHVSTCFVDFSKAFDRVNYWKLFNMLLDDAVNSNVVGVL